MEIKDKYTRLELRKKDIIVDDKWKPSHWRFTSSKLARRIFDEIKVKFENTSVEKPLYETAYSVCRRHCGLEQHDFEQLYGTCKHD